MLEPEIFDNDKGAQEIVLSELDDANQELFAQVCGHKCGIALLRFLDAHPNSWLTLHDIAYRMKTATEDIECGLAALKDLGLVHIQRIADLEFFRATTDPARRQMIRDLCWWQDRWLGRIERIEQLVLGNAPIHLWNTADRRLAHGVSVR